ncbi:Hypothetical predicted protein [Mytilus galloprovincialis]|uniref:Uncharacterized protein n=1 Tax=Mytilus galloprovincialis TaxID=29158 RepID=A0A8B6FNL5_MYTGA|nr:Hypothetical predicted protein [Mytilus galloprovincialis]
MECFECRCMQALTWKWILQRNNDTDVTFSCLNGPSLTSETTVMKCSESVVAVESSIFCECSDLYLIGGSTSNSTDIEINTTQNIQASEVHVRTVNPIDTSSNTEAGTSFNTASIVIVSCVGVVTLFLLSAMVKRQVDFLMTTRHKSVTAKELKDILIDEAEGFFVISEDDLFKEQYNNVPPRSHVSCFVVTN